MADLHDLIERVQVMLASSLDPSKEELDALHGELSDEIRIANKRLRECDALLQNGHRSEAIQLAEQEPNLLDVVAVLDFQELPEWNDFVAELGLKVTPELQMDIASDLNSAYSEDEPIEQHLRRFRVYSLARAPLRTRLGLIRRIADMDPTNPVWGEDVQEYEKTRLRQIKDEVREACGKSKLDQLTELQDELTDRRWIIKPSKQLIGQVDNAVVSLGTAATAEKLKKVAGELQQAQAEEDLEWAESVVSQWKSMAATCDQSSEEFEEVRSMAMPALRWVERQKQKAQGQAEFNDRIKRFERSIAGSTDVAGLKKRYAEVSRDPDFSVPEYLRDMYHEKLAEIKQKQQLKKFAIIGGVVVALLAIAALIYSFMSGTRRDMQAGTLKIHLDKGDYVAATAFIEEVRATDPSALESDAFKEQMVRFHNRREQSDKTKTQMENGERRINAIISVAASMDEFNEADSILQEMTSNPLSSQYRDMLDRLSDELRIARGEYTDAQQKEFSANFSRIRSESLPALREQTMETDALEGYATELSELNKVPGLTADNQSQIKSLLENIEREVARRKMSKKKQAADESVVAALGNADEFEAAVKARFSNPNLNEIFTADRKLTESVSSWNEFSGKLSKLSQAQIVATSKDLSSEYNAARTNLYVPDAFQDYMDAVRQLWSRESLTGLKTVRELLENKAIAGLNMMQERSGTRYYFEGAPEKAGTNWKLKAFQREELDESKPVTLSAATVVDNADIAWLSPQSQFSKQALEILNARQSGQWEQPFAKILNELLEKKYDQMDPRLRLKMYQMILKTGSRGSRFLESAFSGHDSNLQSTTANLDANWCDSTGQSDLGTALRLVSRLRATKPETDQIGKKRSEFFDDNPAYLWKWIGWVVQRDVQLTVEIGKFDLGDKENLYALARKGDGEPIKFQQVGRVFRGNVSMSVAGQYCRVGQRVYIATKLR